MRLLSIFAAACVLETFLVSLQAWRGVPSHFNMETPLDAGIAQTLAVGGFTLVAVLVMLTIAAFRDRTRLPVPLLLAVRTGLVALVGAQVAGGVMIATGVRLVLAGNPQLAYATGGWLKPVHAALIHGILVLPLLAWLISRTHWDERAQGRVMWMGIVLYALAVGAAVAASVPHPPRQEHQGIGEGSRFERSHVPPPRADLDPRSRQSPPGPQRLRQCTCHHWDPHSLHGEHTRQG